MAKTSRTVNVLRISRIDPQLQAIAIFDPGIATPGSLPLTS